MDSQSWNLGKVPVQRTEKHLQFQCCCSRALYIMSVELRTETFQQWLCLYDQFGIIHYSPFALRSLMV